MDGMERKCVWEQLSDDRNKDSTSNKNHFDSLLLKFTNLETVLNALPIIFFVVSFCALFASLTFLNVSHSIL